MLSCSKIAPDNRVRPQKAVPSLSQAAKHFANAPRPAAQESSYALGLEPSAIGTQLKQVRTSAWCQNSANACGVNITSRRKKMEENTKPMSVAGSKPSLVQSFAIDGLFGYRSLSLESEFAATIVIARNGAGKTTLLGALDAFLRCQFGRLAELTFARIECKLRNIEHSLVLQKNDLDDYMKLVADNADVLRAAKQFELDAADLLFFVLWEFPIIARARTDLHQHAVFQKIYQHSSQTYESAVALLKRLSEATSIPLSPLNSLRESITAALSGVEVVYLPTYRRIELSLPDPDERLSPIRRQPSVQARLGLTRRTLYAGDIQFGLTDISARLRQLNQEIMFESNQKYAEISANIVDDLISGSFEQQVPSLEERPSKDELKVFFERMKGSQRGFGLGAYYGPYGPVKMPDIDKIYSGNIPVNSQKFLTYFLGKLNSVIQKTRETERVVESFIQNCNRYLSSKDPTTVLVGEPVQEDEKILKLDRATLDVSVSRRAGPKDIPLDALSSGEKQMISLFARLYLYPKDKLVLIDEPELSLSIDWQRKILPDILSASLCKQVIAITHSPFIFDNDLDAFAAALHVRSSDQDLSTTTQLG